MTLHDVARGLKFVAGYTVGSLIVAQLLVLLAHKVWVRRERERSVREIRGHGDVDRALGQYLRNEAKKRRSGGA